MLRQGLVGEVAALRARGDLHAGLPSMRLIGYRQVWEHLEGASDARGGGAEGCRRDPTARAPPAHVAARRARRRVV